MPATIRTITRPDSRTRVVITTDAHNGEPYVRVAVERWSRDDWRPTHGQAVTLRPEELVAVAAALRDAAEAIGTTTKSGKSPCDALPDRQAEGATAASPSGAAEPGLAPWQGPSEFEQRTTRHDRQGQHDPSTDAGDRR